MKPTKTIRAKLAGFVLLFCVILCALTFCESPRDATIRTQREKVLTLVKLGEDIFEARDILVASGFRIEFGPGFMTESRRELTMIIDFGVQPSIWEDLLYSAGISKRGKLINGVIKADSTGKITSIK